MKTVVIYYDVVENGVIAGKGWSHGIKGVFETVSHFLSDWRKTVRVENPQYDYIVTNIQVL